MADLSRLKGKGLGAPPPPTETRQNLAEPEIAPARTAPAAPRVVSLPRPEPVASSRPRIDGRTARRTGRVVPFATRVSEDFDERFRAACERDNLKMVDLLEQALDAYEKSKA